MKKAHTKHMVKMRVTKTGYPAHTASTAGTVDFVKIPPDLEASFIHAALVLGTRPMKFRDAVQRASYRKRYADYFRSSSESLPPVESWPTRLHCRMSDSAGNPLELFEKLAIAYMWWIDEQNRRSERNLFPGPGPATGETPGTG